MPASKALAICLGVTLGAAVPVLDGRSVGLNLEYVHADTSGSGFCLTDTLHHPGTELKLETARRPRTRERLSRFADIRAASYSRACSPPQR